MKTNTKKILWFITYSNLLVAYGATPAPWDLIFLILAVLWAFKMDYLMSGPSPSALEWTRPMEYPNDCLWSATPEKGITYSVYSAIGCDWHAYICYDGGKNRLISDDTPLTECGAKERCEKHWRDLTA